MGFTETSILYLVIGTAIGAAIWVARTDLTARSSVTDLASWVLLWPFFAPAILGRAVAAAEHGGRPKYGATSDGSDTRLHDAQGRLLGALRGVEDLADGALRPHLAQIDSMTSSLDQAQVRLAEMEELLRSPEFDQRRVDEALRDLRGRGYDDAEPRVHSLLSRRRNIERLTAMRDHTRDELERALLRLEEMSSQILLLRFADHPEKRLAALLKDVAGNVEDLAKAVVEMNDLCQV